MLTKKYPGELGFQKDQFPQQVEDKLRRLEEWRQRSAATGGAQYRSRASEIWNGIWHREFETSNSVIASFIDELRTEFYADFQCIS